MKTETKHTPGPWKEVFSGFMDLADIIGADGIRVVRAHHHNAKLIAAAPDLLEACKTLIANNDTGAMEFAIQKAKIAIAKTEGGR